MGAMREEDFEPEDQKLYGEDAFGDIEVDMRTDGLPETVGDSVFTNLADGSIEVDMNPGGEVLPLNPQDAHFDDNLADFVSEAELGRIGQDVCEAVKVDLEARREWLSRFRKGMEILGVIEPSANLGVLKHAREVNHPLIAEAIVQYQARAVAEAFPPEGPVKAIVLGKKTPEKEAQASRVAEFMNYQLLVDDRGYFPEADQGYFILGMEGSTFKKVYRDPLKKKNCSKLVMARDFVVPYSATSLEDAPRYTHLLPYTQNDVLKLQRSGYYRDCALDIPTGDPADGHQEVVSAQDAFEGKQPSTEIEADREHLVYEQHTDLDLPGFEDADEQGEATGIKRPYIVHVDRDTEKVLAIFRNWKDDDEEKKKRIRFAHYKYLPGPGFYGLGLVHVIGGLGAAATGILRLIMVTAAFAGAGGGFRAKDGAKAAGSIELEPGVFKDVDSTLEELQKTFFQPQFKEPPESLFKVLGLVTESGQRFASSTEAMTGDAPSTGPVGTMVALIEQGSKVFSGIHKRTHMAAGDEFRLLSELNGEYLPRELDGMGGYPYDVPGASREVFAEDFDERIDVVPVSDPNIFSATQRIAVAQSLLQMSTEFPEEVSRTEAVKRMVNALRAPDAESLLIRKDIPRYDAVSENALLMIGRPVKVFPDQDHAAHMAVVAPLLQDPNVDVRIKAAAQGHYAEHQAQQWLAEAAQAMGSPMLPLDAQAERGQPAAAQLKPEVETMLSRRAAMVINKLRPPQPDAAMQKVMGELELKRKRDEGELKLKAARMQAEVRLDTARANHDMALDRQVAFGKMALQREVGHRQLEQDGQHEQAKQQRESMLAEKKQHDEGVTAARGEVDEAIKYLASAMQQVVTAVEHITGGAGGGQPA